MRSNGGMVFQVLELSLIIGTLLVPTRHAYISPPVVRLRTNTLLSSPTQRPTNHFHRRYHRQHHPHPNSIPSPNQSLHCTNKANPNPPPPAAQSTPQHNRPKASTPPLTSAIFKIAFDGTYFHGWSAANHGAKLRNSQPPTTSNTTKTPHPTLSHLPPPPKRSRSRRHKNRPPGSPSTVRSVEGTIRTALARIYGDVDPSRVRVEGCSRTDRGVHAGGMVAMVFCVGSVVEEDGGEGVVKRCFPDSSVDDSVFVPLPFGGDLGQIAWVLNKMLPPDVRVVDVSPVPSRVGVGVGDVECVGDDDGVDGFGGGGGLLSRPFHPSLDAEAKTYRYTFSLGEFHDPTRLRTTWHTNLPPHRQFNLTSAQTYASTFLGTHDFRHFQGTERGSGRSKTRNNTICTIEDITIEEEGPPGGSVVVGEGGGMGMGEEGGWSADSFSPLDTDTISSVKEMVGLEEESSGGGVSGGSVNPFYRTFVLSITGDRFLYKMVRFIAGAIVTYGIDNDGEGDGDGGWVGEEGPRWRSERRVCAPAHGLVLDEVWYDRRRWGFRWNSDFWDGELEGRRRRGGSR